MFVRAADHERPRQQFRNTQARTEPSTANGDAVMSPWVEKPTPLGDGEVTCLDNPPPGQINLFPAMHKQNQEQNYQTSRRQLLIGAAAASVLALTPAVRAADSDATGDLPQAFAGLKPLGGRVHPITTDEFRGRLLRAQKLMTELEPKYDALF